MNKTNSGENKVSVIGLDDMGIATVFALLTKEITKNICMIDINDGILQGEHTDIQSSALFLKNPNIISSKDPEATRDSKICVITTGTYRGREETEADYVTRNAGIIRAIVPPLVKYSPETIFIVASEPVDVLSYVTWKLTEIPKYRVIGTGTMLDTARFRYMLSEKFGVSPECCHANIIGQHGDNSVPVWSSANVGGVRLQDINPHVGTDKDPEKWNELHKLAVTSDKVVRELKGSVCWSMALVITEICKAVFTNSHTVTPVSTYAKGEHAIRDEVFVSLPCVLARSGVTRIVRQSLTESEGSLLRRGSEIIANMQEITKKIID